MEKMSPERMQEIVSCLQKKGATLPCPRCGNKDFTLLDGYLNQSIQLNFKGLTLGGPSIPSAVVVCKNCGYMSQHALGVLGLLPEKEIDNGQ